MKKTILLTILLAVLTSVTYSQVAINETGADPDPSAILDLSSTDKGFLVPRVSTTERNAIATTQSGLLVYDIDTESFWYYNNMLADWVEMSGGGADNNWIISGNNMYSAVSGNVGIGTISPQTPLDIYSNSWDNIMRIGADSFYNRALIFSSGAQWASISGSTSNRDDIVIEHETGEIGIGTTSPAAKLDVNGSIRMTDGNEGSGKVLVSDAMGIASWETPTIYASDINGLSDGIAFSSTVYLGDGAGTSTTGNNNTGVGHQAGRAITTGFANTSIGKSANENNETGFRNTAIGAFAGRGTFGGTSVSDCIFIGVSAGSLNTSDNKLFIDVTSTLTPLIGGDFSTDQVDINGTIKITGGNPGTGKVLTSDANGLAAWVTSPTGAQEINDLTDAIYDGTSIFLGFEAGLNDDGTNYNLAVGKDALKANTSGKHNTAIGYKSQTNNTTGNKNVGLGINTLRDNATGSNNTAVGYNAGIRNTTGYSNTSVGTHALYYNTTMHNLVAIGDSALFKNGIGATLPDDGADNTAIGSKAMYSNTIGYRNTAVGSYSMEFNQGGDFNTAFGYASLRQNTQGNGNTAIGNAAMAVNTDGENNTVLGWGSLFLNNSGDNNVAIGKYAGFSAAGSGNVFIGNEAGYSESGSNTLYIDNSNTNNPLIKGDFSTNFLEINGELTISERTQIESGSDASLSGGGFLTLGVDSEQNICFDNNEIMSRNNGVGSVLYFQHDSDAGNTILNSQDGSVGIGTSAPNAKLHVSGNAKVSTDLEVGDDITADEFKYGSTKTCILKIPAAAFSLFTNQDADRMLFNNNGYWHIDNDDGNGAYNLKAGVNLPDGAIVTRLSFYYRCDGEWITVKLQKKDELSISSDVMASYQVLYNYFAISRFDDTSISYPTIDNNGRFYYITAEFNGHDQLDFGQLHGAEIEYTINKITP